MKRDLKSGSVDSGFQLEWTIGKKIGGFIFIIILILLTVAVYSLIKLRQNIKMLLKLSKNTRIWRKINLKR